MNSSSHNKHYMKYLEKGKDEKDRSPITAAAVQKLAKKGGVKRLKSDTFNFTRELIVVFLEDILRRAYHYNDFRNRIKLEPTSVILALRSSKYNIKLVAGSMGDVRGNIIKMGGGGAKSSSEDLAKEIKRLQKSTTPVIPAQSFERLCRMIVSKYLKKDSKKIMFKKDALLVLHDAVESYIIKIMESAHIAAAHANRVTTEANDMAVVETFKLV